MKTGNDESEARGRFAAAISGIIKIFGSQSFGLVVGQKDKISNANKPISPPIIKMICGLLDSGSRPKTPRPKNIRRLYPVNPAAPLTETRLEKLLIARDDA